MRNNKYSSSKFSSLRIWIITCLLLISGLSATNVFAQTTLIDPAGDGGFNNGSTFASNGWSLANSTGANLWVVGTSTTTGMSAPFSGNKAYTSNDAGVSNGYNNASISVNYFWRDVTIPIGEPNLNFSFNWVSNGESTWDMIQLFVAPTSVTPAATVTYPGSGLNVTNLVGATWINSYNLQSAVQTASGWIVGTPGTTVRIIFGWKNDGSGGTLPAGSLDNISLVSNATLPTIAATATGGLWSSPATWAGGVVPSGTDVSIPSGSIVTVDQAMSIHNLDITGVVQWNGVTNAMTLSGDLTINAGGRFLPYTAVATPIGQTVNIGGNFTNNGYANCALGTGTQCLINFNGSGSTLGGSGTFQGDGSRGIIRQLFFQNLGSNSITTTQNLTTYSFAATAGSVNTNGKLKIDNTAQVYGQAINTQVSSVAVTNMGVAYSAAPVVFGAAVTQWSAIVGVLNTLYVSGNNVYRCTAAASIGAAAPVHTSGITDNLLWIGTTGTLGNAHTIGIPVLGTQYFIGNNLYTCVLAGTANTAAGIAALTTGAGVQTAGGTSAFIYVGSPAKVSVNYDATTQTVRSLSLTNSGSGYSSATAPGLVFSVGVFGGTVTTTAAAFPVIMYAANGPLNSLAQRSGAATISGGLTINSDQGASGASADPQASSGVGNVFTTNGGVNYTVAPQVAFGGPLALNLITNPGSGYPTPTNPTITVSGGTLVAGGVAYTSASFLITVNQGTVQSVYLTATTASYIVPPTLTMSASPGVTATLAFPAGCWPAATANIGSNGQITSFTMTNAGYGYNAAPLVSLGTSGTFTTAATVPTSRVALYNLTLNFFSPAVTAVVAPDDATIPSNRKMNNLSLAGNGNGLTLTGGNLTLYGTAPLTLAASLSTPGNVFNLGGSNLYFSWNGYAGATNSAFGGANNSVYVKNGSITLTGRGGAGTFNYPFAGNTTTGSLVWFQGSTPTAVTTGCNATKYTVTELTAPTNTIAGGGVAIGNRSYRAQYNTGAVSGLNPTMTLHFNSIDGLTSTQDFTYVAEAPAQNGPWNFKSTAYGVSGALPVAGLKATATVAPGPISGTADNYYAFATVGTTVTSFNPAATCGGGTVVITGTGFTGASSVTFGGTPALSYIVNSATQITAVVSNTGSTGLVVVIAPTGTGTSAGTYTFNGVGPIVSIQQGSTVTICPAASTNLTALPGGSGETYLWSTSETTQSISVNAAGTYTCTVTNTGGCFNAATANVVISTPPAPVPTATPSAVCAGSTSQLNSGTFISGTLSTPFNQNNGSSATGFDITNITATPVVLHYFSFQSSAATGTVGVQSVYYNPTPMNCVVPANVTTAPGWILIGSVSTTSAGTVLGVPTVIPLDVNITIPAGATYAFAVGGALGQSYTSGTSGCPVMGSTAHLSVKEGFGGTLTGTIANRRWNGTVTYDFGDPNLTYAWTESPAGPTLSSTSIINPVATPTVPVTYTVVATNSFGCSGTASVPVTVNPVPSPPTVTPPSATIFAGDPVSFTATGGPGNTFTLWSASSGGTLVFTGATYTGAGPCTTTTFYAEESNGLCVSTTRTPVVITVNPIPAPVISGITTVCGSATTTLTAPLAVPTNLMKWYDAPTGGLLLYTGTSFVTPVQTINKTYYAAEENTACVSTRTAVLVTRTTPPTLAIFNTTNNNTLDVTFCGTVGVPVVQLNGLTASDPSYVNFAWSETHPGALSSFSGSSPNVNLNNILPTYNNEHITLIADDGIASGCQATVSIDITAFEFPVFNSTATPPAVCLGQSTQLSAGVSSGNFSVSSTPYAAIPLPGSGVTVLADAGVAVTPQSVVSLDDGGWYNVPIGFNFNFFSNNYTTCNVSTNGNIQFGATANFSTSYTPGAVPSTAVPNNFVGLFWTDLYLSTSGTIRYWIDGFSPNRIFVIEYNNVPGFTTAGLLTGQIWLHETTGVVETHITSVTDATHNKVCGVENLAGTDGNAAPGRNGTNWQVSVPEAWKFQPPVIYTFAWTSIPVGYTSSLGINTISPTVNTHYDVLITDPVTGCTKTDFVDVVVNPLPTVSASPVSSTVCSPGGTPSTLSATGSPGATYAWTPTTGLTPPSGLGASVSALPPGTTTYTVTATTAAGCTATDFAAVSVTQGPSVVATATPSTVWAGSNVQLLATATSVGYIMNPGCATSFIDIGVSGTSIGALTDDGSIAITIPSFTFNGVPYTTAVVGTNGVIVLGSSTIGVGLGNVALPTASITAGSVFLAPWWDDLDVNLAGTIRTQTVGNIYIIQWNAIDHNNFTTGTVTFQVQLNLTSGVISFVYQDVVFGDVLYDAGASATVGIQFSSTSALQYSFNSASLANGQSICFTPNVPSVTYDWSLNPTFLNFTNIPNPLASNVTSTQTYSVAVTDGASGCTNTQTVLMTVNAIPAATSNSPVCIGDALNLFSPLTGTSYSWTTTAANAFTSTAQNPTIPNANLGDAGIYTCHITFAAGPPVDVVCTVVINTNPVVAPTASAAFCETTAALDLHANAPTGVSYVWKKLPSNATFSTSSDPSIPAAPASASGTYRAIATDANGCRDSANVVALVYALPPVAITVIGNNNLCTGQTTSDLQGTGVPANGYSWSTTETTDLITVSTSGTYTLTGTDANGCVNTDVQVITESAAPAAPVVTPAGPINLCSSDGGATYSSATLTVTNYGTDLLWSTSETTTSISVDYADIFNVTYTDGNGCYSVSNPVVTNALLASSDPTGILTNITNGNPNNICLGSGITLSVDGGSLGDMADWYWYEGTGACGTGTARGNGPSVTLTPTSAGVHRYTVRSEGPCGNTVCASIDITVSTAPPTGTSHYTASVGSGCNGTSAVFSTNAVAGATYYSWSGTSGALFNGNPGPYVTLTPSVTVTFATPPPAGNSGYSICSFAGNSCGQSNTICTWVRAKVSQPGIIIGANIGCPNTGSTYSVPAVTGANTYTWTITGSAGINGGGATLTTASNSITVNFGAGWTSGSLSVYASLTCGFNSASRSMSISSTPSVPGIMAGPGYVCPGNSATFSVPAVSGAASYNWTCSVPGAVLTPSANSCSILFPAVIPAGSSVCVSAVSSCGNASAIRCKGVANGTPNTPGAISGPTTGQCGQTGVSYSILPVAQATGYLWTVNNGATVFGPNTLSAVTINFPSAFTTCTLTVVATNGCGTSIARTLVVNGVSAQPGVITGNQSVCNGAAEGYTSGGSAGATSYNWTVPAGATILGVPPYGSSITVLWGATSGNVTVAAVNDCGTSISRNLAVAVTCRQSQVSETIGTSASLYPNPTSGKTTVKFESVNAAKYVISVVDVTGRIIIRDEVSAAEGINMHELDLTKVAKGIYLVRMETAGEQAQLLKVTVE